MVDVVTRLREHLAGVGLVRAPDTPGPGARPWLPPAWKHRDEGAIAPGYAEASEWPETQHDDGLVVTLQWAPGIPPAPGEEDRRRVTIDVYLRGTTVPAIHALESAVRGELLGDPPDPGGRCDWNMAGLYVIQSVEWKPYQPVSGAGGGFSFLVGYLFEIRYA